MNVVRVIFLFLFVGVDARLEWRPPNIGALDQNLYEEVLHPELCDEQIKIILANTMLAVQFADAGIRIPRGILQGNTWDLGNYYQCLSISHSVEGSSIQGKYCMIRVPLNNFEIPGIPGSLHERFGSNELKIPNDTVKSLDDFNIISAGAKAMAGDIDTRLLPGNPLSALTLNLAVCIPKPCSTEQALTSALFNLTEIGFEYQDEFCRLPNDKPWSGADYAIVIVVGVFAVVTLLSTCYDLYFTFINKNGSYIANSKGKIFSVYTNGRRLMTFTSGCDSIECVDGIRALAMLWVLVGHAFTSVPFWANPIDTFQWVPSLNALWLTSAHITVDTFFTLSGMLVVYTTAGKLNGKQLIKNIHLFYLNRLLRMFPLLALTVLYEASYLNRMTDGPVWTTVVRHVDTCRSNWWPTLLHIQNYLNPEHTCVGQSWYLAIDVQLHILSSIVLFFVLSGRRTVAWIALTAANIGILVVATVYNFHMEFPSGMMSPGRGHQMMYYLVYYYVNTLTRAAPFLVGMIIGYILHLYRDTTPRWSKITVACVWVGTLLLKAGVIFALYPLMQPDWDNQMVDSLFNSFIRPIWAISLGLLIVACHHGYGGPINWLLSLHIWKLPARISYAMYLVHFGLMLNVNHAALAPVFFSVESVMFTFLGHFAFTFVVSFLVTLIVDAPFSTIFKILLGKSSKRPKSSEVPNELTKDNGKQM
ncbi:O-acyltransferase like protein [Manduca sexta]|uniref:Nose resistant-to-fluoxetine protein N-terminal domain-containing protein n=1 Tax=Manduca sexta TaxID=7130 RepID=A0A921YUC3_MANSE|nr:O-acyltransferase like protein [Manduca sexta]KAG6445706.1 hypothetical protein O3G_MSEX004047 [Manduca sexta]